jgi:hypothetical protein|tara:strand:- start:1285 stop:1431 length:147 start_codon:yes stop_codon:yes gene_type:complete
MSFLLSVRIFSVNPPHAIGNTQKYPSLIRQAQHITGLQNHALPGPVLA